MTKFSDLNIKRLNSKIKFDVPAVSIHSIVNCEIDVLDYEAHVTTKFGDDKYIVLFSQSGVQKKFFTSCESIKNDLNQIDRSNMPFTTTIVIEFFATGKTFKFT